MHCIALLRIAGVSSDYVPMSKSRRNTSTNNTRWIYQGEENNFSFGHAEKVDKSHRRVGKQKIDDAGQQLGSTTVKTGTGFVRTTSTFGSNTTTPSFGFGTTSRPSTSTFGSSTTTFSSGFGTTSGPSTSIFGGGTPSSGFGTVMSSGPSTLTFGSSTPSSTFETNSGSIFANNGSTTSGFTFSQPRQIHSKLQCIDEVLACLNCSINAKNNADATPLLVLCKSAFSSDHKVRNATSLIKHGANVNLAVSTCKYPCSISRLSSCIRIQMAGHHFMRHCTSETGSWHRY